VNGALLARLYRAFRIRDANNERRKARTRATSRARARALLIIGESKGARAVSRHFNVPSKNRREPSAAEPIRRICRMYGQVRRVTLIERVPMG